MNALVAIALRDLLAMVRTPAGWVIAALFTGLNAALFSLGALVPGEPASMRYVIAPSAWLLVVVCPAISMRSISEELRTGTMLALRPSPAGDGAIAAGKFLGAAGFFAMTLLPSAVFPVVLMAVSDPAPDPGPILTGYLGVWLAGLACLGVGTLISSLTDSQTLSFLATMILLLGALLATSLAPQRLPAWAAGPLSWASPTARVATFAAGLIDTGHVAYFLVIAASGVALAAASLALRRRW